VRAVKTEFEAWIKPQQGLITIALFLFREYSISPMYLLSLVENSWFPL